MLDINLCGLVITFLQFSTTTTTTSNGKQAQNVNTIKQAKTQRSRKEHVWFDALHNLVKLKTQIDVYLSGNRNDAGHRKAWCLKR